MPDPQFEIRKGVPVPLAYDAHGGRKYPWDELEVGDSFVVPLDGKTYSMRRSRLTASSRLAEIRLGRKFVFRAVPEGVGVWRTK